MDGSLPLGLLAGLVSAALFGLAAVAQASAVRGLVPAPTGLVGFVGAALRSPLLLAVVAAYLVGFVLHAVAIWFVPLYLAQSLISFSLPVTVVAVGVLGERVKRRTWVAVAAVTVGLTLLARGSGAPGPTESSTVFTLALVAALALLLLASRTADRRSGAALGWLAGLGYAGSAIAVRGLDWPVEGTAGHVTAIIATAVTVPAWGLLAFWLYSLGLSTTRVTASTAPLITMQTVVPALVGLALLGDSVREGGWPWVALGFTLALVGAVLAGLPESGATGRSAPPEAVVDRDPAG